MRNANQTRLKPELIKKLEDDYDLDRGVANKLNIDFYCMPTYLKRNSRRLTEMPVLKYLSQQLNIQIDDLVCETNIKLIA